MITRPARTPRAGVQMFGCEVDDYGIIDLIS